MSHSFHLATTRLKTGLLLVCVLCSGSAFAQTTPATSATQSQTKTPPAAAAPKMPATGGEDLDRIDAIVNGDLILDSDVNEELRLAAFQPYRDTAADMSRDKAIERLINRDLILQQAKITPEDPITDAQVDKEISVLRTTIPECKRDGCETDAGWQRFLSSHGFTADTLRERWRGRMIVLRFIEDRFRMGIRITPAEIQTYYDKTMLPEYARQHVVPPPALNGISDRIQEVLLQQRVSALLGDWLTSLRAQGSVVILKQGEVAP